ncbi:MAG: glutamate--tRNA ligase [bacterium]
MLAVRFAPSPTGFLHIGGARTAIFNWLYAKKHGGKFFLRIEDTDFKRSGEEMTRAIIEGLRWLGLDWEGEPVRQSERIARYQQHAQRLLESGHAYRSFVSDEALEAAREQAKRDKKDFRYRETFPRLTGAEERKQLAEKKPFAIRLASPPGKTGFNDLVHGEVSFDNAVIDDFIILRSDSLPTYHLAVVVDDHEMSITHVLRGDDHISNTPKQIMLYNAFGWQMPVFAHVPLILGTDKTRLSKRHGATAVGEYEKKGFLPEALFNYLALLGWSPGDDRELLSREELIALFDTSGISKSNAVFDEKKLEWLNGHYLSSLPVASYEDRIAEALIEAQIISRQELQGDYLRKVIGLLKTRLKIIPDFVTYGAYFFRDPEKYEEAARAKHWKDEQTSAWLSRLADDLKSLPAFGPTEIETCLRAMAERSSIAAAKFIHAARLAVTGFGVSPSLFDTMAVLGKETVVRRLRRATSQLTEH